MAKKPHWTESISSLLESWGIDLPRPRGASGAALRIYGPAGMGGARILIGVLSVEGEEFVFRYDRTYAETDLPPILAFPDKARDYRSTRLWPFFRVRLPSEKRPEVQQLMRERNLDYNHDMLRVLGELGKRSITNPYELEFAEARS